VIAVVFVAAVSTVIIVGGQVMPWQVGQRPSQDIRVRVGFQELDEQATNQAKEQAKQSTPNYYLPNQLFLEQINQELNLFYTKISALPQKYQEVSAEDQKTLMDNWHVGPANFQDIRQLV